MRKKSHIKITRLLIPCLKKRYNDPVSAMAIALFHKEQNDKDMFYYKCSDCAGYHLTSTGGGTSISC